jgi:hypothetical protein
MIVGKTASGSEVRGKTAAATPQGDDVLEVQYHWSPLQASWTDCHVGGNPNPNTKGCKFIFSVFDRFNGDVSSVSLSLFVNGVFRLCF